MSRPATRVSADTRPERQRLNTWQENADFWVQIIRGNHDRYRTGLTNAAVLNAIGPASGLQILDAGCGEGYMARDLASQGADVLGVDLSANLIQAASALSTTDAASPRFRVADVTGLDDADSSYDLVLCNDLMNDLPDPRGPIAESARVLKPDGRIVILMLHPCFYNDRASRADGDNREVASAYFTQRKVTQQFNVDGIISPAEVTSWHRPLQVLRPGSARRRAVPYRPPGATSNGRAAPGRPLVASQLPATAVPAARRTRSKTASNSPPPAPRIQSPHFLASIRHDLDCALRLTCGNAPCGPHPEGAGSPGDLRVFPQLSRIFREPLTLV